MGEGGFRRVESELAIDKGAGKVHNYKWTLIMIT